MNVEKLEQTIAHRPPEDLARFAAWFDVYRQRQEFDDLIQKAREEHRTGKTTRLT